MSRKQQQHIACLWLLELLHWWLSVYAQDVPSNTDPNFIKTIVDDHNKYRSQVSPSAIDMLYMSWDGDLANIALSWAQKCKFSHNPDLKKAGVHPNFKSLGENIWMGSGNIQPEITKSWASEVADYDYGADRCTSGKVCGHYTQVVWAKTYKVGCGAAFCKTVEGLSFSNAKLYVCDYGPAGNYRGKKPYEEGQSCSACAAGETCEKKLCRNAERDKFTGSTAKPGAPGSLGGTLFVQLLFYSAVYLV